MKRKAPPPPTYAGIFYYKRSSTKKSLTDKKKQISDLDKCSNKSCVSKNYILQRLIS